MTGLPVSSIPRESMRPPCFAPVLYSLSRNCTPNITSMFLSMTSWRRFSSFTEVPGSSVALPLESIRNSLRSPMGLPFGSFVSVSQVSGNEVFHEATPDRDPVLGIDRPLVGVPLRDANENQIVARLHVWEGGADCVKGASLGGVGRRSDLVAFGHASDSYATVRQCEPTGMVLIRSEERRVG